jgi:plastocyanin domain-containing protein
MSKKLITFFILYILTYAGLATKVYFDQGDIDKIMSEPVTVSANITKVETSFRSKKGVKIEEFDINYTFETEGKEYSSLYSFQSKAFEQYKGKKSIEVVYKKTNPTLNKPKSTIEGYASNGTFFEKLLKLLIFALVVALIPYGLIGYMLGWIKLK